MLPRHTPALLLLPSGLLAGHALSYPLRFRDHASLGFSMEALVCISMPFALAALVHAAIAGLRDTAAPVRYRSLALPQVALFLMIEVVEHASSSVRPAAGLMALILGVAAQMLAAAVLCGLAKGAHALGRRARGSRRPGAASTSLPARWRPSHASWSSVLLTPLSRRGPPGRFA